MNKSACLAVLSTLALSACLTDVALYCDETVACTDSARPFCDIDGTYEGISKTCIAIPSGLACANDAECTLETEPICDALCGGCESAAECAAKDTAAPLCRLDGACVACIESSDCSSDAPLCTMSGGCETCTAGSEGDSACAARDASEPRCADDGRCVECLGHDDCSSEVCEADTESCVEATAIIYVAAGGVDAGDCSQMSPCASVDFALEKVSSGRETILVRASASAYLENISLIGGTVTILGTGASLEALPAADNTPVFELSGGANLRIEGLTIGGGNDGGLAHGVSCSSVGGASTLTLVGATIESNSGVGISASGCTVSVERSVIADNQGGGISLTNSSFSIENNFIVGNGDVGSTEFGGVRISNSGAFSAQTFHFNTVARNRALSLAGNASGVRCVAMSPDLHSNIIRGGLGLPVDNVSGNCAHSYSNIEGGEAGAGNIDMDPAFMSPATGNFHLDSGSPSQNTANPAATLDLDFDGDSRPQGSGFDMGADEITE